MWIVALACFPLDPTSEASSPSLGQGPHAIDPLLKGISTRLLVQVVTKANTTGKDERGSVLFAGKAPGQTLAARRNISMLASRGTVTASGVDR